jgi:dihydrofolate synthase/folylpolyglutamate synthase
MTGFTITGEQIKSGISGAEWPARLQRLGSGKLADLLPQGAELWLDGGHNPGAGEILGRWVRAQKKPVHLLCGMLSNKDTERFLQPLAPYVRSLAAVTIEDEPLGQLPERIIEMAKKAGIKDAVVADAENIKGAIEHIVKHNEKEIIILICGSLYLAGNILWQNSQNS